MAKESVEMPSTIGFVGLGIMGRPMAENLVKKLPPSSQLYIFDINKEVMKEVSSLGQGKVHVCTSAKEVAERSV